MTDEPRSIPPPLPVKPDRFEFAPEPAIPVPPAPPRPETPGDNFQNSLAQGVGVLDTSVSLRMRSGPGISVDYMGDFAEIWLDLTTVAEMPPATTPTVWTPIWDEVTEKTWKVKALAGGAIPYHQHEESDILNLVPDLAIRPTEAPMDGGIYGRSMGGWVVAAGVGVQVEWDDVTGKPDAFPPELPIQMGDVAGLDTEQDAQDAAIAALEASQIDEAPINGVIHGRKDAQWVPAAGAAVISDAAPAGGDPGTFWWSSQTGTLHIRYQDTDSAQWVAAFLPAAKGDTGATGPQGPPGADGPAGPAGPAGGGLTQAAADALYVNIAGDAMTGQLNLANAGASLAPLKFSTSGAPTGTLTDGMVWASTNYLTIRMQGLSKSFAYRSHDSDFTSKQSLVAPTTNTASITFRPGTVSPAAPAVGDAWYIGGENPYFRHGSVNKQLAFLGDAAGLAISDTAPATPTPGLMWWSSTTGILSVWYVDANTSQWVAVAVPPDVPPAGVQQPMARAIQKKTISTEVSWEIMIPPGATMVEFDLGCVANTVDSYPTMVVMEGGVWKTGANDYVTGYFASSSGAGAAMRATGYGYASSILVGNQSNAAVPTTTKGTVSLGNPATGVQTSAMITQYAFSSTALVQNTNGLTGGARTEAKTVDRIGIVMNAGFVKAGSYLKYEIW
jgi:hypothetical protein